MGKLIYWLYLAAAITTTLAISEDFVVNTFDGPVRGHLDQSYNGRPVVAFQGIPYAKPPVGSLRFKAPQPSDPWTEIREANQVHTCMQYNMISPVPAVIGDEDCLYLDIYMPQDLINSQPLDVVVHIHGGGFEIGDPTTFAGFKYIMDRDVIYVTINYRLGILGFLSFVDLVCPGNYGLKDQSLALKWIKKNIGKFEGNTRSITLTGWSAGGVSVHLHHISPLSRGQFHRGLSHSGSAINSFAITKTPVKNAMKLGTILNCDTQSSQALIDCLRSKPATDVVGAMAEFLIFASILPLIPFGPVVERNIPDAFLPDDPYKLIMQGKISNDRPWVSSNVANEGIVPVGFIYLFNQVDELNNQFDAIAPDILEYYATARDSDKARITANIRKYYFGNEPVSRNNGTDLVGLFTDRMFYIDQIKAVEAHAKNAIAPVYYFRFSYPIEIPVFYKAGLEGIAHGEDVKLLYNQIDNPPVLPENDRKVKDILLDFLYGYASTGRVALNGQRWPQVSSYPVNIIQYANIRSPNDVDVEGPLDLEPFKFWHRQPLCEDQNVYCNSNQLQNKPCVCMFTTADIVLWLTSQSCYTPRRQMSEVCSEVLS